MESRIEALERQLRAAEERARRAEEEARRAEEEARRAEEETRPTTLTEYIRACHSHVFTKFTVQANKSLTSKGQITSPAGKRCPARLEPWTDFLEEQKLILGKLFSSFPADTRAFRSQHYLNARGNVIGTTRIGDEETLKAVLQDILGEPVKSIVERLQDEDSIKADFDIGAGITFETRLNAISDFAPPSAGLLRTPDGNKLRPDQICAYRRDEHGNSTGRMAYIIEHKAPHKLTPPDLRLGLRPMNIYEDVVNRATRPVSGDTTALFQYNADRLAAAAVTQTFDYMVEAGLTYGCLTTGEAIVFLRIDWTHPMTLYYHLAEPGPEVDEHNDDYLCCTAVSQMLAFTILAMDSQSRETHGQDERRRAIDSLKTWSLDYDSILRSIPLSERTAPPTSPAYQPRTYKGVDRSPYLLRRNRGRAVDSGCRDTHAIGQNPSPEQSDDEDHPRMPGTPSPTQRRRGGRRDLAHRARGGSGGGSSALSDSADHRQYCTQRCLVGLIARGPLDKKCPNIFLHQGQDRDRHDHPVDHATWLDLLVEQLGRTLDDGIVPLRKQGARGVLFKVTLLAFGYTFVAKGTTATFVRELEHEVDIYRRLRPLQGIHIPVFLGATNLRQLGRTYYYDFKVYIVYLMFISWGGLNLDDTDLSELPQKKVAQQIVHSVLGLHKYGVAHTDVRSANILWNPETGRPMVIDFEQAVLAEPPRPTLAPVVTNKRLRRVEGAEGVECLKTADQSILINGRARAAMQEDIWAAKIVLRSDIGRR